MAVTPDDAWAGLRARDPSIQAWAWAEHRASLIRVAARVLGPGPAAEDVADETLLDFIFGGVDQLQHAAAMGHYLRLCAARRAIKKKTRGREDPTAPDDLDRASVDAAERDPWIERRLDGCLDTLTPKARAIVRMKFKTDIPNERIGALLGGSKQYIGRVVAQSLVSLRACLDRGGTR